MMWHLVAAACCGALGRRIAGGLLEDINNGRRTWGGDYPVRAAYGVLMGSVAWMNGLGDWQSLAMAAAVFIGACMGSPWGTSGGGTPPRQALDGFLDYVFPAALLAALGHYFGAALLVMVATGSAVLVMRYVFPLKLSGNPTEWVWGAIMGIALAIASHI